MGTAAQQGEWWGAHAADWAAYGEPASRPANEDVFARMGVGRGIRLVDLGCGAGTALVFARELGADVSGLDASGNLVALARSRLPGARIEIGDLESLPFADGSFDVVTGFNSFQFAGDIPRALAEAARVCREGGSVAMCVWGPAEECESFATTISAIMAFAPPPPPSARPPLSTPGVVEELLAGAGLSPIQRGASDVPFRFPSVEIAWRTFASAGLAVPVIRQAGEAAVKRAVLESLTAFTLPDGSVLQANRFHWVIAKKPA